MKKFIVIAFLFGFINLDPIVAKDKLINPNQTYTYQIMKKDLKELETKYHKDFKIEVIGKSHFKRAIYAVKLGKGKDNVLIIGAHHGREWITTALIMNMIEEYAGAYEQQKRVGPFSTDILDKVSIWFVPMLNPDGVEIQQGNIGQYPYLLRKRLEHLNEGSKDFTRWKANGRGIDLNRQYPAGWEALPAKPFFPSFQFFKGKRPLEAKEVRTIVDFTKEISPIIAVAYHSSGREIYWKYNNDNNLKRDEAIAGKVSLLTGYPLSKPPKKAYGGGYTDWFISTFKRPAMTIEICPLVEDRNPPISTFNEEWERNKFIGIMLADEAQKLKDKAHKMN